jgi:hypothetical protein
MFMFVYLWNSSMIHPGDLVPSSRVHHAACMCVGFLICTHVLRMPVCMYVATTFASSHALWGVEPPQTRSVCASLVWSTASTVWLKASFPPRDMIVAHKRMQDNMKMNFCTHVHAPNEGKVDILLVERVYVQEVAVEVEKSMHAQS